ncbi:hypothetical protein HBB16_13900 [Pseudonocardia sp. MCCB 268]|nr:hypothetical protein [Pseudonocardia cytotoxica]
MTAGTPGIRVLDVRLGGVLAEVLTGQMLTRSGSLRAPAIHGTGTPRAPHGHDGNSCWRDTETGERRELSVDLPEQLDAVVWIDTDSSCTCCTRCTAG